jgi:hypothetical protein
MNGDLVWGGILLAGVIAETIALRNKHTEDTLSERTRAWFRVRNSKVGRTTFTVGWIGFAIWFLLHILEVI